MKKKPLIVLTGPTAAGKTEASIRLAKAVGGEVISADSVQIYKYMDIGSAKITREEMEGIPHYLVDELMPDDEFNVVVFQKMAQAAMDAIYKRGRIPILVGGTGFYIQSVLYGIEFDENESDSNIREELTAFALREGAEALHAMLQKVDQDSAKAIHPNNTKRVIRALEYYKQTGLKISGHNQSQRKKESPYRFVYFVLNQERELLYERINSRVDEMLKNGLVEEVKGLRDKGYDRSLVSMQGLGYKEIYAYLEGDIPLSEAVYRIKRGTRHFAKRQLTWFKREREVTWLNLWEYKNQEELLSHMLSIIEEKGIKKGMQ